MLWRNALDGTHRFPGSRSVDQRLEQGIAGHAIGAVRPVRSYFSGGVESGNTGFAVQVCTNSSNAKMSRRPYRKQVLGEIDVVGHAGFMDARKTFLDRRSVHVRSIDVHERILRPA